MTTTHWNNRLYFGDNLDILRNNVPNASAGWPVVLPGPSDHGPRSHTNAQISALRHYLGGTLSLRHSGMFCRRP